ncbi:hypothetical protein PSOLA_06540 [Candidatus Phytoplasma solani]
MPNFKNKKRQLLFLTSCLLPIFLFFFNMFFFNIVHALKHYYKPEYKKALSTFTHDDKNKAITVTQAEVTNPTQATVNKFLQTPDTLTLGGDVTITFNANERKATITAKPDSTTLQGSVVFTNVTVEKQDLSTFTKTPTDQAITVTQEETTTPTQDTLNKFLQTAGSLTVNTDVTITFNANERKATLASAPDSTKVQGSVVFTNVTVEKQDLSTFTKPTTETITVTQAESTNPTQATVNKFLQTADTLTVGTDVTITFNANERKATLAVVANSTRAQGDNVVFTNVTVEKQDLSTFTKTPTDQAITVTQAESTNPTQATVNKFLQTADTLTVGTDVTITFNANERKATLAVVANSTRAQGDNVVFTNVTVEKQDLSTFTKTPTDQAITVTQAESTNPTQATVNKFLQTADTLTVGTDVTITFNANERKATLAVVANSTRAQGDNVVFTNVTVEKQDLSTFTKTPTETITVTQAEVTSKDQNALNKFLKQDGSLTVNTDATITFNDVDNKKTATITAAPNSTQAQGSVVFTNVKVAQPTAPVVDANATTAPTATTDNRQPNADTNATQQSNGDTNASGQLNAGKTSPADNKLADEKPADDETVKKPTDEAGTKKVADETVKKPADDEKPTDEAGAQTAKPVVTAPEAEAQKAKELEAQKTKEAETQKIEGNTETQKTEGNTETKNPAVTEETSKPEENKGNTETQKIEGNTETKNPAVTEETSKPEENQGNTETKTTVENPVIKETEENTETKTTEGTAKKELNTLTKTPTQAITVTQAEVTTQTQDTLNKFLNEDGKLKVGDVTFTFNANERKATITAKPDSTTLQGSVDFTNVTVENPTQNPVSVQTPPTNNQNTEESSNDSKTILICLTIFLTITLTVLIGLFIHNSKKQK